MSDNIYDGLQADTEGEILRAVKNGCAVLHKPMPLSLPAWAEENFYLSAESSYVEGKWVAFPFQKALMGAISNDDIREVTFMKSARVGCTKIILASMAYFAEHKKRNQAVWQPSDSDADEFVKTEIDTMLRDVDCMHKVFPYRDMKHKNNTMQQKAFTGSMLHIRGGKAAKNYRRISVDVVYLDELDGFDHDIEREGDPVTLATKRTEGATFPKVVCGSTPKIKGSSMIERRFDEADVAVNFYIPCPHCDKMQFLKWGSPEADHGFKWEKGAPDTVEYLCEHCQALFGQDEFLNVWGEGKWMTEDGYYLDDSGNLFTEYGKQVTAPMAIGFKIWTAYSPMTEWSTLVREFERAKRDPRKLKGFVNLTLGESWEEDQGKKMDEHALADRREPYDAEVPDDVVLLTIGADCQDDRVEFGVTGWAAGEESYRIDFVIHHGDPSRDEFWSTLHRLMRRTYAKEDGTILDVKLVCIDSGGHFTDEVYRFCRNAGRTWAIPTKGSSQMGKPIATFPPKANRDRVYLTMIGTDTAKDLVYHRLQIEESGHGYCHFPDADWCNDSYFKQMTAERRKPKFNKQGVMSFDWFCPSGRRNEVFDIEVLNIAAIRILQQRYHVDLELLSVKNIKLPVNNGGMNVDSSARSNVRRQISSRIDY